MKITLRTDENICTSKFDGGIADILLGKMVPYTKVGVSKNPNKKIYIMVEDMAFNVTDGVSIMFYKGFYLVVE